MMDITEWHIPQNTEWQIGELPPDSNPVIIAIRGIGGSKTVCIGCYTSCWGMWHRSGSGTEVHVLGWAYLIEWRG